MHQLPGSHLKYACVKAPVVAGGIIGSEGADRFYRLWEVSVSVDAHWGDTPLTCHQYVNENNASQTVRPILTADAIQPVRSRQPTSRTRSKWPEPKVTGDQSGLEGGDKVVLVKGHFEGQRFIMYRPGGVAAEDDWHRLVLDQEAEPVLWAFGPIPQTARGPLKITLTLHEADGSMSNRVPPRSKLADTVQWHPIKTHRSVTFAFEAEENAGDDPAPEADRSVAGPSSSQQPSQAQGLRHIEPYDQLRRLQNREADTHKPQPVQTGPQLSEPAPSGAAPAPDSLDDAARASAATATATENVEPCDSTSRAQPQQARDQEGWHQGSDFAEAQAQPGIQEQSARSEESQGASLAASAPDKAATEGTPEQAQCSHASKWSPAELAERRRLLELLTPEILDCLDLPLAALCELPDEASDMGYWHSKGFVALPSVLHGGADDAPATLLLVSRRALAREYKLMPEAEGTATVTVDLVCCWHQPSGQSSQTACVKVERFKVELSRQAKYRPLVKSASLSVEASFGGMVLSDRPYLSQRNPSLRVRPIHRAEALLPIYKMQPDSQSTHNELAPEFEATMSVGLKTKLGSWGSTREEKAVRIADRGDDLVVVEGTFAGSRFIMDRLFLLQVACNEAMDTTCHRLELDRPEPVVYEFDGIPQRQGSLEITLAIHEVNLLDLTVSKWVSLAGFASKRGIPLKTASLQSVYLKLAEAGQLRFKAVPGTGDFGRFVFTAEQQQPSNQPAVQLAGSTSPATQLSTPAKHSEAPRPSSAGSAQEETSPSLALERLSLAAAASDDRPNGATQAVQPDTSNSDAHMPPDTSDAATALSLQVPKAASDQGELQVDCPSPDAQQSQMQDLLSSQSPGPQMLDAAASDADYQSCEDQELEDDSSPDLAG
ncbi:hypothetical protein WJX73_003877 [Symbiochloris irregularis]|uniref:Uncharacterized protein n=1 Tax=Symbiochloris irregularis TaxID=706552 RepID=A0AAW1Q2K4_9CHLO